jgi:rhodanese-related sulfurtransferase
MTTLVSALIGAGIGYAYYHYIGCISGTCPIQTNPFLATAFGAVMATLILPDSYAWIRQKVGSAGEQANAARYENISREQFHALKDQPDTVVLDVRTPSEWASGHVPGAALIDFNSPDFEGKIRQLDPSKTYLVYCRSGRRSMLASNLLVRNGFTQVKNVTSGERGLF